MDSFDIYNTIKKMSVTITEILKDEPKLKHESVISLLETKIALKETEQVFLEEVGTDYGHSNTWIST